MEAFAVEHRFRLPVGTTVEKRSTSAPDCVRLRANIKASFVLSQHVVCYHSSCKTVGISGARKVLRQSALFRQHVAVLVGNAAVVFHQLKGNALALDRHRY